ncbi:uncharacterized protein ACA1_255200 [Acanthamoeba castellanii str. Neff]|uniref:Uncharacterized protein n=1 Tax=Acanthamoeba castellanii (strain ATCC 30010 / Neff) TaxID=1257118 RepID=L8HDE9_ACACF|nr:uncharacterized protein ACA1_255200 [Acanthamoeba castellanii str. Neff]ELR22421.1 hypothetical protein ACA1_255200 [Acanthamoeba castellanii str. Neff]
MKRAGLLCRPFSAKNALRSTAFASPRWNLSGSPQSGGLLTSSSSFSAPPLPANIFSSSLLPGTAPHRSTCFSRFASTLRTYSLPAYRRLLSSATSTTAATRLGHGRTTSARLVAATTRRYVTLNELQRGGKLHLVYTGPNPATIRTPAFISSFIFIFSFASRVFLRDVLLLCTALIIAPFCSHLVSYASGMDKASFERVMLWWLKYREKGPTPPHTGYTIVDGQELQKVLETKLGRPYTMEILESRLDDKINALADNMDGVELLIISGKKTFGGWSVPYLTVGIHARIRWTETVKIVEKRDLSTQLLKSKRVLIEKVELAFADNSSFGRQKRFTAAKLNKD